MHAQAAHAAAHAAAVANAIKASGVVVRVEAGDFLAVLKRTEEPLVVVSYGGLFKKQYKYLTSYKGLAFFTKSPDALLLPPRTEVIAAKAISIPDV
jgi:hypothetical protein